MTTLKPTGPFLYVQFVPKAGSKILLPNGRQNPHGDLIVAGVGPDVPENQGIKVGSKIFLREDAKSHAAPIPNGDIQIGYACLDYRNVMAVLVEDGQPEEEVTPLTDEEMANILPVDR